MEIFNLQKTARRIMSAFGNNFIIPFILMVLLASCKIENVQYRRCENLHVVVLSSEPSLNLDMVYYNPNLIGCRIKNMGCIVITGDDTVATAISSNTIRLKALSEFSVPVNSYISTAAILKITTSGLLNGNDVPVNFVGDITLQKFIFKKKFHFDVREKINSSRFFN